MSSIEGLFLYGYVLGGNDHEWKIEGLGEFEEFSRPWLNADNPDFCGDADDFLLDKIGDFRRDDFDTPPYDAYREAKAAAARKVGVQLDTHGHHEYSGYVIFTKKYSVHQSETLPITRSELDGYPYNEWNAKLQRALELLDIRPEQKRPYWLLTAEGEG
jgi:hypothetical protein